MKIVSICDDKDICTGLRLTGIEGDVVHTSDEFAQAFKNALTDRQVAIVIITKALAQRYTSQLDEIRFSRTIPLIVEL